MGLERGRERDCTRSCKSGVLARVVCVEGTEPSKDSSCLCPPSCHRDTGIADVNHCIRLYLGSRDPKSGFSWWHEKYFMLWVFSPVPHVWISSAWKIDYLARVVKKGQLHLTFQSILKGGRIWKQSRKHDSRTTHYMTKTVNKADVFRAQPSGERMCGMRVPACVCAPLPVM